MRLPPSPWSRPAPDAEPHPAELSDEALLEECDVRRGRAGGPGGQRRNKVETAITIKHRPTGQEAAAAERRSQPENQRAALRRLRLQLARSVRRVRGLPTERWSRRVADGKLSLNPDHRDFPALLAEALDHVEMHRGNVARAAAVLEVNTSQLVKLLRHDPKSLEQLNADRERRGQRKLK